VASARWRERERVVSVFRVTSKAETGISGESKDVCLAAASEKLARYQDALDTLVRLSFPFFSFLSTACMYFPLRALCTASFCFSLVLDISGGAVRIHKVKLHQVSCFVKSI
jgi:hypothetical protein